MGTDHRMLSICSLALLLFLEIVGSVASAQNDSAGDASTRVRAVDELSAAALRAQALAALGTGDYKAAIALADRLAIQNPADPDTARLTGDVYLRAGKIGPATRQFNRYIKAQPGQLPGLWQRGIALYFNGDHADAAKQFEQHRKVNPHDVENAAWHFLCVAKAKSIKEARRLVLPAPGDPRIPMQEVLEMLSDGSTDAVSARVNAVPEGSRARDTAAFYGDFYLGLYADALGEQEQALMYLRRSAKNAPHHYMGDIARVYAKHLAPK